MKIHADKIEWLAWKKRDGRQTLPHAFRVIGGQRADKSLCHNSPGQGIELVEAPASTDDRCASCDEVLRSAAPRGNAIKMILRKQTDPRTVYEPVHRFDDWDRG